VNPTEWEGLLLNATGRVGTAVSALSRRGDRGRTVGVGASGDKTIIADKRAEDLLLKSLLRVKGVRILSEEAGSLGDAEAKTLAVVDPLDGSSNFERGIPFYCTSVAVVEGDSIEDASVGVVRDLTTGDVYHAIKGRGAKKNGKPIRTSDVSSLSLAVLGVDLSRSTSALVTELAPLISGAKRHVHLGANALELCYLADGTIDAFIDARARIRITDFAAAFLIAKEAGAKITGVDGGDLKPEFDLEHRFSFVASANAALHDKILAHFRNLYGNEEVSRR
jgi:myo-inositol-1(or 4)-monophosphatase